MATETLEEIAQNVNAPGATGDTTSDDVLKRNVVKEVVYKQSDLIAVGTEILPERDFGELDIDFSFPSEIDAEYPVAENSIVDRSKVQWQTMGMTLLQAEARFMITDMARLREQGSLQNEISIRRAAEALAEEKDGNILSTLLNGTPAQNNVTLDRGADEGWDQSGAAIEGDVNDAWGNIFAHSNVREADASRTHLIVPAPLLPEVNKLRNINNVQQSVRDYIEQSLGVSIHFSRYLTTDAIVAVEGEQTGVHGVLNTDRIPLVEEERVQGRGDDYLTRQFFNTGIMEDDGLDSESYRLSKIENVAAPA